MDLLQLFFDESGFGGPGFWIDPTSTRCKSDFGSVPRGFVFGGIFLALLPVIAALLSLVRSGLTHP